MEFRPIDEKLANACLHSKSCSSCACRRGCPVRMIFYKNDLDIEISLQSIELEIRKKAPEQLAYFITNNLRKKRADELRLHKFFEY